MIFHQLFEKETSTYTYLLADPETRDAIIIDPVEVTVERDFKLIEELGLNLKYILETHLHADHITGSGKLREKTGAKIGMSKVYHTSCPDLALYDNERLNFGPYEIRVLATPGHTSGCLTYHIQNMLFTGDTVLIRGCGRTDFQDGSSEKLFESVHKIFAFPEDTRIYPGHDYKGFDYTTVGLEKKYNPRLRIGITLEEFSQIMDDLHLAYPKQINQAVPANMQCGLH